MVHGIGEAETVDAFIIARLHNIDAKPVVRISLSFGLDLSRHRCPRLYSPGCVPLAYPNPPILTNHLLRRKTARGPRVVLPLIPKYEAAFGSRILPIWGVLA